MKLKEFSKKWKIFSSELIHFLRKESIKSATNNLRKMHNFSIIVRKKRRQDCRDVLAWSFLLDLLAGSRWYILRNNSDKKLKLTLIKIFQQRLTCLFN